MGSKGVGGGAPFRQEAREKQCTCAYFTGWRVSQYERNNDYRAGYQATNNNPRSAFVMSNFYVVMSPSFICKTVFFQDGYFMWNLFIKEQCFYQFGQEFQC